MSRLITIAGLSIAFAIGAAHAAYATHFATPAPAPAQAPALLLIDADHLAGVKARLTRGDEGMKAALAALERDAAKALAMTPVSVLDKTVTPPSGDKHDYMSQAPYWWPDPAKPDGRPYIRRDGQRNPEINRIVDHDHLGDLNSAVLTLGLAFHLTGRAEYAAHAATLTRVWFLDPATRMNPHLKFGQGIPGITEGRGIGIIETRGLPELLDGITLIAGSPAWSAADQKGLTDWMRAFLTWLVDSTHGQEEAKNGNNHETWYDVQVASLALFTGQPDVARRTLERSRDRIGTQFEPDGRQPRELERTQSWHYSIFNLTAFFNLATLGSRAGVDLWQHKTADGRSLHQAFDFLVPVAAGERPWTYDQITAFSPKPLVPLLRRAAVAWKEPRYAALATKIGSDDARLDLLAPPAVSASAPASPQAVSVQAGPAAAPKPASTEEAAVLAVVDQFMIGISTNDFPLLARIRLENSLNIVERPAAPPATGTMVTRRPFNPEGSKPGAFKERYWDPVVHLRGSLAIVWTPYEFWRDGKTSHCGVDVFELVKDQGVWKIGNAMWTVEPDACPSLRPADPSRLRPTP